MQNLAETLTTETSPWDTIDSPESTLPPITKPEILPEPIEPSPPPQPPPPPPKEIDPITLLMSKLNKYIMDKQMKISRIFGDIDTSGNGILDLIEFRQGVREIIKKADFLLSNDECKQIFYRCDKDRSGELDYKEFEREIKNADLARAAAIKARREASQNGSSLAKKKKKKGKKSNMKKLNWRENRRKIIRASPDIVRWVVGDDFNEQILKHEREAFLEMEKKRKARTRMYRRKKEPSLLKRAISNLPPLPSVLITGDSKIQLRNKDHHCSTSQIVTKYQSRHKILGNTITTYIPTMILGRNSLPMHQKSHNDLFHDRESDTESDDSSVGESGWHVSRVDEDEIHSSDDDFDENNYNNKYDTDNDKRFEQEKDSILSSSFSMTSISNQTPQKPGTITINHGSLRSGAFSGAIASYHSLISTNSKGQMDTQDQGASKMEPYSESNVKEINLSNNHITSNSLRTMLNSYPSISHVEIINLNHNVIGSQGVTALSNAIIKRPMKNALNKNPNRVRHLQCIRLEGNNIGDRGCKILCSALRVCPRLKTLCLPYNNIGSMGGTNIGTFFNIF